MAKTKKSQKKQDLRRIAPIGLWIGGIAILTTIILLVIKFLSTAGIFTLSNDEWLNLSLWISAGLIVIGLAAFVLIDPLRARQFITGRQARYGSNAVILLLAFFGILLVVNILAFKYPGKPMDFSEDKQHSLAPETQDILSALDEPVLATGFYSSNYSTETAQELLDNYKRYSDGNFDYKFIDPDQNPLAAQNAGITGDGKIFLEMGTRHEIVSYASEEGISSALIRLMNPGERALYFVTGHGERDISTTGDDSYASIKAALLAKNYTVNSLNLLVENAIPDDARVIIIAGPMDPLTQREVASLSEFTTRGGSLVILAEPIPLTNFGDSSDPLAVYLADQWGIILDNDIVIDTNSGTQPLYAVAAAYGEHAITQKLEGRVAFFPAARSLSLVADSSLLPVELVATIEDAWGETDFATLQADGNVQYDEGEDKPGPVILAMAAEETITGSRVVVFGDSDFASDIFFSQYANGDILINAIDWAAGDDEMISLSTPDTATRSLNPPSSLTILFLWLSFLCIIPGLVVAGGVASWLIRKSRG